MTKKIVGIALCLVLTLGLCAVGFAESDIRVQGSATVSARPDMATLSLGVSELGEDVVKAQSSVNERIEAIREALIAAGIAREDISVDSISVYAEYNYDTTPETVSGYRVSHQIAVRVSEIDKVGELIDAALAAGANRLDGVSFSLKDSGAAYDQALKLAIADAARKGALLAEAANLTLGGIDEITENPSYGYSMNAVFAAKSKTADAGGSATPTTVDVGMVSVEASVTVCYEAK